jgi:hypothetical protein
MRAFSPGVFLLFFVLLLRVINYKIEKEVTMKSWLKKNIIFTLAGFLILILAGFGAQKPSIPDAQLVSAIKQRLQMDGRIDANRITALSKTRSYGVNFCYHNRSGAASRRTPNPSITNPLISLSHRPSRSCNFR